MKREANVKSSEAKRRLRELRKRRAHLKAEIEVLRAELLLPHARVASNPAGDPELDPELPSYTLAVRAQTRRTRPGGKRTSDFLDPAFEINDKLVARRFAESHGIAVPALLGVWDSPHEVPWDSLPARFVLKSSLGGGGLGVYPIERAQGGYLDHMTRRVLTPDEIASRLWERHSPVKRYFAEEFLTGRDGSSIPHDVKVFCFYGEPGFLEVRAEDWSRTKDTVQRNRTFLPDGTEVFDIRPVIPRGEDIDPPHDLGAIVDAASRLSRAIRRPAVRLDFFETGKGLVFGEVTPNPGRTPSLRTEFDRRFGAMFEAAYDRLLEDLVSEGTLFVEFGDQCT